MKASAAILRSREDEFLIEDLELADAGPGEILVKIAGTGVCHSDLLAKTFPPDAIPLPTVFGHEGSGIVEAVGPGVTTLAVGDHVVLTFDSCGSCSTCVVGEPAYCTSFLALNMAGRKVDGTVTAADSSGNAVGCRWFGQSSFATHSIASVRGAVKVDPDLPIELLGPLGCGMQTGAGTVLEGLRVGYGSSVAVFGVGAVGMAAVMAARIAGATRIIAVDLHKERLDLALELGATHAFDGSGDDVAGEIVGLSGGVDFAIDTTAVGPVMQTALSSLGGRGHLGLVGVGGDNLSFNPAEIAGRSISYHVEGRAVPQVFIPRLIEFWQDGRFPFDRLIRTYPLGEVNKAIADSLSGVTVKPVLIP